MDEIKIIFKFIRNIVWALILEGVLAIITGVLIFIYPDLLGMLTGTLLVISGIFCLFLSIKVNYYSKIKIKL